MATASNRKGAEMFDLRTRQLIVNVVKNPLLAVWRMLRLADEDLDRERKSHLLNAVLALPDRVAARYQVELDHILKKRFADGFVPTFPYPPVRPFLRSADVEQGMEDGLPYLVHGGKRLFFPANWKALSGISPLEAYVNYICTEGLLGTGSLSCSPHCYQTPDHHPETQDVLLDIGCAEALYALEWVDKVRKVCLFEGEKAWRRPLQKTFAPYSERAVLIDKFVGPETKRYMVRLQDAVREPDAASFFIKMDIEGAERFVISSASEFLRKNKVKLSVCCYHRQDDAEVLGDMLEKLGYRISFSDGYLVPEMNGIHFPYFRKAMIYGRNY